MQRSNDKKNKAAFADYDVQYVMQSESISLRVYVNSGVLNCVFSLDTEVPWMDNIWSRFFNASVA